MDLILTDKMEILELADVGSMGLIPENIDLAYSLINDFRISLALLILGLILVIIISYSLFKNRIYAKLLNKTYSFKHAINLNLIWMVSVGLVLYWLFTIIQISLSSMFFIFLIISLILHFTFTINYQITKTNKLNSIKKGFKLGLNLSFLVPYFISLIISYFISWIVVSLISLIPNETVIIILNVGYLIILISFLRNYLIKFIEEIDDEKKTQRTQKK